MFNILHNFFCKRKIQENKYSTYPMPKNYKSSINIIYNEYTKQYEYYH